MMKVKENLDLYDPLATYSPGKQFNLDHQIKEVQKNSLTRLMQAFLREKVFSVSQNGNGFIFHLPNSNHSLIVDDVKVGSLARYTAFGNIYLQGFNNQTKQINGPLDLLHVFMAHIKMSPDRKKWENLFFEISDHLRNAVLSSYKSCHLDKKIVDDSRSQGFVTLLQWLKNQKNLEKNLFFEQWVSQGHPYHPCSKTKLGFSLKDVIKYSPEFHPEVCILIIAIKKDILHIEAMDPATDFVQWFADSYPGTWEHWVQGLQKRKLCIAHYIPFPIHPWQAKNKVRDLFEHFIADGRMIFLDNVCIKASPTLSFRSLAPMDDKQSAYIKLPIAVQATSVFRTLAPGSTENTPKVSRILHDIFARENNFGGRLRILREIYGLHLNNIPDEEGKHLTAIFRENPNASLAEHEVAIVIAALYEKSPVSGLGLFIELMHSVGITQLQETTEYFHNYVDKVLGGYLDLYLCYGIGLEGHQQNTLAVFCNGSISGFIARDFDGIDIHKATLNQQGYIFQPYPGSPNLWEDKRIVCNSLLHTVYQSHLGDLVLLLANHFHCTEQIFWKIIKTVTLQRFTNLKNKMNPDIWQADYQAILKNDWPCKALLRMRLQEKYNPAGLFFNIKNPLAQLT